MKLIWRKRSNDYIVYVSDNTGIWGCGQSIHEAIGDLVLHHPESLGIEIGSET